MANFEDESDNIVMKISKEFIDEQPKIGTAVKNLIAMVLGKSISDPSTCQSYIRREDVITTE